MTMQTLFLEAPYKGKVELCRETLKYLKEKKYQTVALYSSVQFVGQLDLVREQLEKEKIVVITSTADRTHVKGQLLGCDNYHSSLNLAQNEVGKIDGYLYVGDGRFHPLALVYAQKDLEKGVIKEIICNDPIGKKMVLVGTENIKTILRKYRGSLMKFLAAKTIGVITTIKPGQEQFRPALVLEEKYPQKKFYQFIDNDISFQQLENFPFIEVWVNTACPRVGFDDQEKFAKGVINLNDALQAESILSKESILRSI